MAETILIAGMEVPVMREEAYWKLFWKSGLPEAWMMSRLEGNQLFLAEMAARGQDPGGGEPKADQPIDRPPAAE